jgi:TonB family protein
MDCLADEGIVLTSDPRPPVPPRESRSRSRLVGISIVAHVGALAGVLLLVSPRKLPPAPRQNSFEVVFEEAPDSVQTVAAVALPPPAPIYQAAALAPVARLTVAGSLAAKPVRRVARVVTAPAAAAPVQDPSQQASALDRFRVALAAFEARVHAAVQLAARYPSAARLQRREGCAQIRFDYRDGAVSGPVVAQSSQSGELDLAALAAVAHASLPRPPAEIGAAKLSLAVWVDFRLVTEE